MRRGLRPLLLSEHPADLQVTILAPVAPVTVTAWLKACLMMMCSCVTVLPALSVLLSAR